VLPRSGSQIDALARSRFVPDFRSVRVSGPLDFSARAQLSVAGLPRAFSRGRSSPIFVFLFVSPARVRSFFGHRSLFASLALDALSSRAAWFLLFAPQSVVGSRRFSSVFLTCERSTPSYVAHVWSPVPSSSFSASFPRRRFGPSVPMKSTGRSIFLVEIPALRAGAWICSPVFLPPVSSCHSWSPICCLLRMFLPDAVLSPFFLCREQGAARISCRGGRCSISVSRSRACISCSKLALFSAIFVCNSLVQFSRVGGARPGLLLVLVCLHGRFLGHAQKLFKCS
jgi:hypothetical protein